MHDKDELEIKGLPQGEYDIPMALTSKRYNNDGTLWSPEANGEDKNLFGDIVHVNGQPWPYFKVEPRKYRLRFLNAAISRSWELYLESAAKAKVNMKVRPDSFVTTTVTCSIESNRLWHTVLTCSLRSLGCWLRCRSPYQTG
jgi:hypothetical protein